MADADNEALVLIWSGEHHAYWRPNSAGYTIDGLAAGVYPRDQAEQIARGCDPDKKIKLREIPAHSPVLATLRAQLAAAEARVERLREALRKAARTFRDYDQLHRAKMSDSTPTVEWLAANRKADRDGALAVEMEVALKDRP